MSEFGEQLSGEVQNTFLTAMRADRRIRQIRKKIRDGTDYDIANDFAIRTGELLSEALRSNTRTLAYMSEEVAREVLEPALTADYEMVVAAAVQIQKNMNAANGFGVEALGAGLDTSRIDGLIGKVASYDTFDEARWVIGEPIVNYSQAVVDYTIKRNAEANSRAGLNAKIYREIDPAETAKGNRACRWCQGLAGTYDYADVRKTGNDVFRRHRMCRCRVTYNNAGNYQDVWSKTVWTDEQSEQSAELIRRREQEIAAEREAAARRRETRLSTVEYISVQLGYSDRAAAMWLDQYREDINRYGLNYMIDYTRNQNEFARRKAAGIV